MRFCQVPLLLISADNRYMILTANIGSASKKYSLFREGAELLRAHFERENKNYIVSWNREGAVAREVIAEEKYNEAARLVVEQMRQHGALSSIGIRVVAPGAFFARHQRITDDFITKLETAQEFAPLHVSATLAEIKQLKQLFPNTPLFAASDSAFHSTLPKVATIYGLPKEYTTQFELQRFGYHGLSLASIVEKLRAADSSLPEKVIICHLGSGCSITALQNGKSVETSMGFSPLEGLVMSTRSGSIDPAVVILLAEKTGLTPRELEKQLNSASGLLAVGGSSDIRELLTMEENGDKQATLALSLFVHRIKQYIGAYAAILGGVDALVFTGTIGERSAVMRQRITEGLEFLRLQFAPRANSKLLGGADGVISKPRSAGTIYVLQTNEANEIAKVSSLM